MGYHSKSNRSFFERQFTKYAIITIGILAIIILIYMINTMPSAPFSSQNNFLETQPAGLHPFPYSLEV